MKNRLHFLIAGGVLIIGLIIGSFLDLQINAAIFSKTNMFGLIVSAFGMIPGYGALSLLGGALLSVTIKDSRFHKALRVGFCVIAAALYGLSVFFLGRDVFSGNGFNNESLNWLGFVIMGVIMVPVFYFGYRLGKLNDNPNMWIIVLILAFAIFMALVPGVTLFKAIMHRPRYRIAIYEHYVDFHNWWEPCKEYKDIIAGSLGRLDKDEFKSFPSGHAGATMCSTIFLVVPTLLNKKWMKYQTLLFYIGFGWALVVMFARLLVGAHFLSDVSIGALLTIIFFYIGNEVIVRKFLPKEEPAEVVETPTEA